MVVAGRTEDSTKTKERNKGRKGGGIRTGIGVCTKDNHNTSAKAIAYNFDFCPLTLGTASPDRRKSGYFSFPYAAPPADMRQDAPSTVGPMSAFIFHRRARELLTNERLSGYIASAVGEEKYRGVRDITDGAKSAERLGFGIFFQRIRGKQAVQTLRNVSEGLQRGRLSPGDKLTSVDAMGPGAMMFEVTPSGPNSMATLCDKASTPALATDTWVWKGMVL